jgi:glucose/arabinose dehydrogenase
MRLATALGVPLTPLTFFGCGDGTRVGQTPCPLSIDGLPPPGCAGTGGASGASGGPAACAADSAAPGQPELRRTVWLAGLEHPWDVAFLPTGEGALITERPGRVSLRDGAGAVRPVAGPDDVLARGEGGLLGLTLDPEFATNRLVYTCFSHRGEPNDNRVVRWRLSDDAGRLEQRLDLITGMPYSTGRHSGCRLLFGSDGYLYVGTGDAAQGANPQDVQSLGGKVLRVTRDGEAAPDNPPAEGKDPRVLTFGHRNVQGLAEQPGTGRLYSGEHGPGVDDEVNVLLAGRNYGWAPGLPYEEGVPMTDLEAFPDAVPAVWSSGRPTTALSGIAFLAGDPWGAWDGALVAAELKNRRLRVLRLDATGAGSTELRELCAEQGARLRTPVLGPDGALYVTTDDKPGGDEIWRLAPR